MAAVDVNPQMPGEGAPDALVRRFLDLGACLLREETCDALDSLDGVIAYRTAYGWLMYVSEYHPERESGWPDELPPLVALARHHGCSYILFDCDGPTPHFLPTFEW